MVKASGEPIVHTTHNGIFYQVMMRELSAKRNTKRYLEIGVDRGVHLSNIHADVAVGVDPRFTIEANVTSNKRSVQLFQITSDAFFADVDIKQVLGGAPELIFLDGMHTFEFLLRDFYNCEAISQDGTLVAVHDCFPLISGMAARTPDEASMRTSGTPYQGYWTGDVWKIIPILKEYRPDLRLICVDSPPTGLLFITNLTPSSDVLKKHYLDIVDKYKEIPNDDDAVTALYNSIHMNSSWDIIYESNHSQFFRI